MPAKRKSKSLHALHSTRDQSTTRTAPTLSTVAAIKAPSYLSKPAKDEFNRVAKELADAGLLTNVSLNILASYAASFANWKLAEQDLQERGATIFVESTTRTGKTVRPLVNPAVRSYAVFKKLMLDSAKAFGIDPASHGRINLPETNGAECELDPFEQFLTGELTEEDLALQDRDIIR
jgi:P27 family predicted phage terminase small subunit